MTLLEALKQNENIRRIFGKSELIILEKQLWGIPLKPSERTRLSRDIRKKFNAIAELSHFSRDFKLRQGDETRRIIGEAKETILESKYSSKIKRICLFGSTAEKEHLFKSDIDIAVEFTSITPREAAEFRIKTHVPDKVDLQVYNVLPEKIKKQIDKYGKTIYSRD